MDTHYEVTYTFRLTPEGSNEHACCESGRRNLELEFFLVNDFGGRSTSCAPADIVFTHRVPNTSPRLLDYSSIPLAQCLPLPQIWRTRPSKE